MDDVAYSTFIRQRLALEGTAGRQEDVTPFALVMLWARWLYEEYLPQGRVLRYLASNMALFAVGCVLLYATPGTFIPTPSLLNGGGTVWVFTGSELAFLLASVCFSMICLVDLSVIISTENPLKRQLVWVIFCINLQAAFTYTTLCWDYMPVFADGNGRPLYALRWLMWACSTASLIFMISELARADTVSLPTVIASDVGGLLLGFFSKCGHTLGWVLLGAGFIVYLPTVWGMYRLFAAGSSKLISRENKRYYHVLGFSTIVLWSAFPCVHVLANLQLLSPDLEATLYFVLDLGAKGAYSMALLRSNYYSIDQLDEVKRLGSEEILCKALATTREIELAGRILLTAKSEAGAVKQLHRSFLSHMSHELRTPLNHMIGFNELLIEDTGLSAMQRTYITAALNSAKGLLSMIDNILEYSRLEGSVIQLDTIDFDLYDVLDDVIDALRKQAVSYGVDIVYRLELKGISASKLIGDPHRLSQMIKHLVDNAIKSYDGQRKGPGPSGVGVNTVEIRVHVASKQLWNRRNDNRLAGLARWNEVSRRDGLQVGTLTVEVEDHGKGIPEKEMNKLFTPFGQVESRGKSDGIGLGLAIVKQLADAMGGRASCTSAEGVGSTFFIHNLTMPVSTKHTPHHYNLDEESVLIVAKPPLLHGLAHQLHSLWVSPEVVDASCPEQFARWLADTTASTGAGAPGRAVAQQQPRPESEVLIIDAQLLPRVQLVKLPYKRMITLSPPSKAKETVTDGPTQAVPEDLMRPVTRRTLRDVLVAVTGEREGPSGATPPLAIRTGLQPKQQDEGEARQASGCPFLVLVVDDNKVNLKVVGAMLRRLSVPYETANDGIDAIEQICKTRYDLVLMDLSMPRMGGLEATRIVRTIEKSTHEPPIDIVAMTAATSKEDEEECMRSGFTLYLPKPVKYGAVKELVERKMQEKQRRMHEQEELLRRANALERCEEEEEEEEEEEGENPTSSP